MLTTEATLRKHAQDLAAQIELQKTMQELTTKMLNRMDNTEKIIDGKFQDYNKNMQNVGSR